MTADLRLGRWQDVLEGVECDALIFDAPFGKRTHAGHDAAPNRAELGYECFTPANVIEIVDSFSPRCRGWFCTITSHDLAPCWRAALEAQGRYVFAPLPVIDKGRSTRMLGDGPCSWSDWLIVARPRTREMSKWGTLPGYYMRSHGDDRSERKGGKPLDVMRAIVRDYTRPGDLVCDTHAGHGTTLLAALTEGREAIGAEVDPEAHAAARARLGAGYTPDMFAGCA